jgi:hypothetical protein
MVSGGCRCGQVRFTIEANPIGARACWCRDCQYWGSGNATINVVFPSAALRLTGETADFESEADSGNAMHRRFCPKCGTPLFSEAEARPHLVIVRAGALDDPEVARPGGTIWTASAPSWGHVDPDLPQAPGPAAPSAAEGGADAALPVSRRPSGSLA